ncbi:LacI family DNA-binding transcriptional regulator [Niallia sp. 01092]|uniref:LacI family DNA-binding transcriptional regulator n=1 Tax=unclassified Niallia TaxID=2837522 RepID=UPI003FD52260
MKPKIKDVAKLAGVSPTTVSRVLNNRGYIGEKTKKNVYKAMKELNYYPNELARSLFNKRTNVIGLIIPTTVNPFFGELTFEIENVCASIDYKVLICNSLNDIEKEEKYLEMLMRNQVDGIIVGTHNQGIVDYQKQHLAVVAIDRTLAENIPIVSSDNYEGGKLASELLVSKGCSRIIHINGPVDFATPAMLRRKAYEDVMLANGREPITYEIQETFNPQSQSNVMKKILAEIPDVDGVFASNDIFAASFIREAKARGKKIPQDLKVIGYDGTETAQSLFPDLTTIQQPIRLLAESAIEILLKQMDGEFNDTPQQINHPVKLLLGETT